MGSLSTLRRAGMVRPIPPKPGLIGLGLSLRKRTMNMATAVALHRVVRPRHEALVDDAGRLTWAELDERVNRLANVIRGHVEQAGVEEDPAEPPRVAFMLRNGREAVELYCAAGRAGAAAVPVNVWSGAGEVAHVVGVQDPVLLVADREVADVVEEGAGDVPRLWVGEAPPGEPSYEEALAAASDRQPDVPGTARVITHTSGTTGKPKGAERDVGGSGLKVLVRFLEKVPLHRTDRFLLAPPLFHSLAQGMMGIGLVLGTTLVLPRRFDPEGLLDLIEREEVTAATLVPVMLRRLLEVDEHPGDERLRIAVLSGEPLPTALREDAEKRFGRIFHDLYGATEVGWATIATPEDQVRRPGTVGRPGEDMRIIIVGDDGEPLPAGEEGRIYVVTGFEFDGYTGLGTGDRDELAGAVEFGDVGWLDEDGYLFVSGRSDDMIVSGGENIYPSEIEGVLDGHPDVIEVAVVGEADADYGQALHAFVVRREGSGLDEEAVRAHVRDHLARYKAPRRVSFLDELPRNATGKVLRRELAAPDA